MATTFRDKAPRLFGAKRRGDAVIIDTGTRKAEALFVGCGRFTCAYAINASQVVLFTFYGDHSKDIMARAKEYGPRNPHLPKIKKIGDTRINKEHVKVYLENWYNMGMPKEQMGPDNMRIMKALQKAHKDADKAMPGDLIEGGQYTVRDYNKFIVDHADVPSRMVDALQCITTSCKKYGKHYLFDDFRKVNMGISDRGQLVLVDPIFDAERVYKEVRHIQAQAIWDIDNLMS